MSLVCFARVLCPCAFCLARPPHDRFASTSWFVFRLVFWLVSQRRPARPGVAGDGCGAGRDALRVWPVGGRQPRGRGGANRRAAGCRLHRADACGPGRARRRRGVRRADAAWPRRRPAPVHADHVGHHRLQRGSRRVLRRPATGGGAGGRPFGVVEAAGARGRRGRRAAAGAANPAGRSGRRRRCPPRRVRPARVDGCFALGRDAAVDRADAVGTGAIAGRRVRRQRRVAAPHAGPFAPVRSRRGRDGPGRAADPHLLARCVRLLRPRLRREGAGRAGRLDRVGGRRPRHREPREDAPRDRTGHGLYRDKHVEQADRCARRGRPERGPGSEGDRRSVQRLDRAGGHLARHLPRHGRPQHDDAGDKPRRHRARRRLSRADGQRRCRDGRSRQF